MNKLLVVCGPTATGKTKLAYLLAKKFNGTLISADSRMVYKYMDIGTGKDIKKYGKIAGDDLVLPNEQFSISQYSKFANETIENIYMQKKLPILVGGSGLYIKSVTDGIETADIFPNETLRGNLKDKSVEELQKILENADSKKLVSMNNSDRSNPRRLMRAIEVASCEKQHDIKKLRYYDILFVGLRADLAILKKRINKRVDERIAEGFEKEIKFLKENGYWEGAPSVTLGYKDFPNIEKWLIEEIKYAKRQMTWFKKDKRVIWFDAGDKNLKKDVEKLVEKWYSQGNAT